MLGIYQWTNNTPSQIVFEKNLKNECVICGLEKKTLKNYRRKLLFSAVMDKEYDAVKWLSPKEMLFLFIDLPYTPDFQSQDMPQQFNEFCKKIMPEKQFCFGAIRYF